MVELVMDMRLRKRRPQCGVMSRFEVSCAADYRANVEVDEVQVTAQASQMALKLAMRPTAQCGL